MTKQTKEPLSAKIETSFTIDSHTSRTNHVENPEHYDRSSRYSNAARNASRRDKGNLLGQNPTVAGSYETAQTF